MSPFPLDGLRSIRENSESDFRSKISRSLTLNGMDCRQSPVHRWYCINEMLPIALVRKLVKRTSGPILEPFLGVGTVLVEAMQAGIQSIGVDVNPFMCFASKVKIGDYDAETLREALLQIEEEHVDSICRSLPNTRLCEYYSLPILQKLLAIRSQISKLKNGWVKDAIILSFVKVAVDSANIRRSPAPRFVTPKEDYPVFEAFRKEAESILEDVTRSKDSLVKPDILVGDSRDLSFLHDSFSFVLTSPPYCNNLDFVRHTQLELFWMDYAVSSSDLGDLRRACITSCEAMAHVGKEEDCTLQEVKSIAAALGKKTDRRLPDVILQYFAGMETHLRNIHAIMGPRTKCMYVVGDSRMKEVYIPTHELIGKIAKLAGFKRVKMSYLRKRFHFKAKLGEYLIEMHT